MSTTFQLNPLMNEIYNASHRVNVDLVKYDALREADKPLEQIRQELTTHIAALHGILDAALAATTEQEKEEITR